jgi:hypothetical protein
VVGDEESQALRDLRENRIPVTVRGEETKKKALLLL